MSPFERSKRPCIDKSAESDFPFQDLIALLRTYRPNAFGATTICVFYVNKAAARRGTQAIGHRSKAIAGMMRDWRCAVMVFVIVGGGW